MVDRIDANQAAREHMRARDAPIGAIRRVIESDYGRDYVPPAPRRYQTKAKNAQEAHEAIRPTDLSRQPQDAKHYLDADQAKL